LRCHICWLLTYPLSGWLMTTFGPVAALSALAAIATAGLGAAGALWPRHDPLALEHRHDDLPPDHPHLRGGARTHRHDYIVDDNHRSWAVQP
jgi:hypothetical protein